MDRIEATRRIVQKYPKEKRPRIIAVTADAMRGDRELCFAAGMDDESGNPFFNLTVIKIMIRIDRNMIKKILDFDGKF